MRRDLIAAAAGVLLLILLTLAAWGAGYLAGQSAARADCATANADALAAGLESAHGRADQLKAEAVASRKRLDKATADLQKETDRVRRIIRETVTAENLGEWYESPVNPVERAALYGVPVTPGHPHPLPAHHRPATDPANPPAR